MEHFRNGSNFRPRKVCSFFLEGRCHKGAACTFAHTEDELHPESADNLSSNLPQVIEPPTSVWAGGIAEPVDLNLNGCLSSLEGPREFDPSIKPRQMCAKWIRHPALCGEGDACLFAHGLMELGFATNVAVKLQTTPEFTPVEVHRVSFLGAVEPRSTGGGDPYGKAKGKSAAPIHVPYTTFDYGKGKKGGGKVATPAMLALGGGGYEKGYGKDKGYDKGFGKAGGKDGGKAGGKGGISNRFAGGNFRPMKLCQFWVTDPSACQKGDACSFAHGVAELNEAMVPTCGIGRFHHTNFKPTQMCNYFEQGQCQKGHSCTYAHGVEEMGA